jgi:hypothetical protein
VCLWYLVASVEMEASSSSNGISDATYTSKQRKYENIVPHFICWVWRTSGLVYDFCIMNLICIYNLTSPVGN